MSEYNNLVIEKIQTDVSKLQTDFVKLKDEITNQFEKLENAMFIKLASVIVGAVAIAFVAIAWMFDYRLDLTNEYNQARFGKLEYDVVNEIKELKVQVADIQRNQARETKQKRVVKLK